jgi:hypothetical protein
MIEVAKVSVIVIVTRHLGGLPLFPVTHWPESCLCLPTDPHQL